MAQLVTTKEKYGVSVATRIDPELAHQISERAEKLGISFSKMVGMLVVRGFNPQEPIQVQDTKEVERLTKEVRQHINELNDLQNEYEELEQLYKNTAAEFISRVASDDDEKLRFVETYNGILHELRGHTQDEEL